MLRAALALADEGGIESLTMRKLGQELGVEAMSLYNHVANKDDIVDGIVDDRARGDRGALRRGRLEDGDPADGDLVARGVPAPPLGVQPDDAQAQLRRRADGLDGGASCERCGKPASRPT